MIVKFWLTLSLLFTTFAVSATPEIERWQTDNGTQVLYVQAEALPMLDLRLVFDAGAARDGDLPGTALMTISMLEEGAAGMSANEIASGFADVGARFSTNSERDMAVLSLRTLTDPVAQKPAVELFSKVVSEPDFPEAAFKRLQNQRKTRLQSEKQSPGSVASRAFYQQLYSDHPYANMPSGTDESVDALSTAALKTFYEQFYVAENAVLVIVGDVDRKQAEQLADIVTATLPAGQQAPALPEVPPLESAKQETIEHPSTQTHLLVGQPGMTRHDPDFFPLYVGNHILGGSGLVSVINDEIREKRGLSYSAYSAFVPMRAKGPFMMSLQTRNEQADEALSVLKKTLTDFIENGPDKSQLTAAQKNITGGFALRVDSNQEIADYLAMMGFYQLPLDYLQTFRDKVNAVSVDEIQDAFQRRINPANLLTVKVGGQKKQ